MGYLSGAASLAPSFQDAQLDQGQKLLKRMRFERKLLRYCQRKAGCVAIFSAETDVLIASFWEEAK